MAKVKIPKRVAGVKIPKKVRKKANKAIRMADSPLTRQIAAAADGIRRFLEGFEEGLRDAAAAVDEAAAPESGAPPVRRRGSSGPSDHGARD